MLDILQKIILSINATKKRIAVKMNKDLYNIKYKHTEKDKRKLSNGQIYNLKISSEFDLQYNYKIRVKGEIDVPLYTRTEEVFPLYYRRLKDSVKENGHKETLVFSDFNFCHERSAYCMIRKNFPLNQKGVFSFNFDNIIKSGSLTVSLEVYYGENKTRYYYETCDEKYSFTVKNGVNFYSSDICFIKKVDFVMLKISAIDMVGDVTFDLPSLRFNGCEFVPSYLSFIGNCPCWIGEGFSRTERQHFIVKINDTDVFDGIKVEAQQHLSGVEFIIPENALKGKDNVISIGYGNDNTVDYLISEIMLIAMPKRFEILGVSSYQRVNRVFGVLVYNPYNDFVSVQDNEYFKFIDETKLDNSVSVLRFLPIKTGKDVQVSLSVNSITKSFVIERISDAASDNVITGTGDFIYVEQDLNAFYEYLSWYLNNNIGNLLTFRCAYRWGRTAECNGKFWEQAVKLLSLFGIYYSLMIDGRELNGLNVTPDKSVLESEFFLGEQTHEWDGSFLYRAQKLNDEEDFFNQLCSRKIKKYGIQGKRSPVYNKKGEPCFAYASDSASNMLEAYNGFLSGLKETQSDGATRHTGVTPHFNALFDAGYSWVGYESLYNSHELLLGAIRGMCKERNKTSFGTHTALQWSTIPADDEKHALRYKISLNMGYMHGATEINTEEGLWTIEQPFAPFDRFSKTCIAHRNMQEQFNKYVQTHTRAGKPVHKIAYIMGNLDGMACFSMNCVYGMDGDEWKVNSPENSWEILKTFYPQATLGAVYCYVAKNGEKSISKETKELFSKCPESYSDIFDYQSLGLFSSTPFGSIDIISAESPIMRDYDLLFFGGWNTCTHKQLELLIDYLQCGKTLIMAKPHLFDSVDRKQVFSGKATVIKDDLVQKLLSFKEKGNLIYFDRNGYPYDYLDEYKKAVKESAIKVNNSIIYSVNNIGYIEYGMPDGNKRFYIQNICWWKDTPSAFFIKFGNSRYRIDVSDFEIKSMFVSRDNKVAIYQNDNNTELLFENDTAVITGYGVADLSVYSKNGFRNIKVKVNGEKRFILTDLI